MPAHPATGCGKPHVDTRLDPVRGDDGAGTFEHFLARSADGHEPAVAGAGRLRDEPVRDAGEAACQEVGCGRSPHRVIGEISGQTRGMRIHDHAHPRWRRVGIDLDVVDGEPECTEPPVAHQLLVRGVPPPSIRARCA